MRRAATEAVERRSDESSGATPETGRIRVAGRLAVCIPTYRRLHLLKLLIADLGRQSRPIERLIVVDGDPGDEGVRRMLEDAAPPVGAEIVYVPSDHGNLSYQRYLGWRAAEGCDVLLYLDDDVRIRQPDAVERMVKPLVLPGTDVVGATARIRFGDPPAAKESASQADPRQFTRARRRPRIVRWFGSARSIEPGGLTPAGHRRMPVPRGGDYVRVEWLHGGVMAYRMDALTRDCFSDDLFALYHVGSGKGEDTFLSRRVACRGRLLFALCATFEHPSEAAPIAYPTTAYHLGHAVAYSRRLLNDHYRGFPPPTLADRWSLVRTYAGTAMLSYARALRPPWKHRFAFASGYAIGAIRGLFAPPCAERLSPGINWWRDAEFALFRATRIARSP